MALEPLTQTTAAALSTQIAEALAPALGSSALPNPEGWRLASVAPRYLMGMHVPVAELTREGATLAFIVTPTDPAARVYKRTRRYDLVYFSEDVPDEAQQTIYARDRATIERFAAWLARWDAP